MIGPPIQKPSCVWVNGAARRYGDVALELLAARRVRARAMEVVRAALCDRVHQEAGEAALAHVVRRQKNLVFLDRFE